MPSYPTDFNDTVVYNGVDLYVPKDCSCTVMEDSRVFLFGEFYLNGQPILTGAGVSSGAEVSVGPTQPVDPGITLWFDTSSGYGELKAKVSGSWKTVENPADDALHDEIYIGGVEPVGGNYELWVDTATDPPAPGESYISVGNALGIVAKGTLVASGSFAAGTPVPITDPLAVNLEIGRRYRIVCIIRSISANAAGVTSITAQLNDGATQVAGGQFAYIPAAGASMGEMGHFEFVLDGSAGVKNLTVVVTPTAACTLTTNAASYFYVEDLGPSSRPALPITVPLPDGYVSPGNALGVVALGSLKPGNPYPVTAGAVSNITNPLSFTPLIGRRYKVTFSCRATSAPSGTSINLRLYRTGVLFLGNEPPVQYSTTQFHSLGYSWIFDGDGVLGAFEVQVQPSPAAADFYPSGQSYFYIEDIGPNTSPALPLPAIAPAWTPLPFAANWNDYAPSYSCSYRKIGDVVTMRGLAARRNSIGNAVTTIAQMPVGFYAPGRIPFLNGNRGDVATNGQLSITSTGQLTFNGATPYTALPIDAWVSLDQVSYSVTP